jgi:hypothetical protein
MRYILSTIAALLFMTTGVFADYAPIKYAQTVFTTTATITIPAGTKPQYPHLIMVKFDSPVTGNTTTFSIVRNGVTHLLLTLSESGSASDFVWKPSYRIWLYPGDSVVVTNSNGTQATVTPTFEFSTDHR